MIMGNGMLLKEALLIDTQFVYGRIRDFISEKVRASRLEGAIVAVSGGIDSAVTLAMTSRALGEERVRALTMPECDITPSSDVTDVINLADSLGVTCDIVGITPVMSVIKSTLSLYDPSDLVSSGNIKPRVRMMLSYHFANTLHLMVIGSSNKSELLTGYFTKYGDGGVDIMPLGDLYKTQVRQLAKYLGISRRIVEKTPTAGLWPGQTDEGELEVDYGTLDLILFGLERGMNTSEISGDLCIDTSVVERVKSRVRDSEHKRRLPLILRLS
jgi:NAD+ synthase